MTKPMTTQIQLPFYAKAALLLIGLYLAINMLSIGQDIILPILYATIIAVLISPVVDFLVRKKINRVVAIASVLFLFLAAGVAVIALLSSQVSRFTDALPQLEEKFQELIKQTVAWVSDSFNISPRKVNTWLAAKKEDIMNNGDSAIGSTLSTVGGILASVFLTPVYIFMILFYQPHLVKFIHEVFGANNNNKVSEILTETKTIIQSYLVGLFAETGIVAVLNSVGLLILGIDYAIVLGIFGALLNMIPYLGGIIAMGLFAVIALVTKEPVFALYVIGLYAVIQFIDNNYIVPKIVGSKVKLNALTSLITVILGAALWGIPGMFLSIPITAVLKLVLDRIEPLKPWGFLLGDTVSEPIQIHLKKTLKKK